ncbi:hypothetical protein L3C95_11845 [Chitinophaga filiformis]|nr:hypothetical protein [Chitinophaga filiformis]MCF6403573.1 hypothetical protein [Chitinophaga filiformis]
MSFSNGLVASFRAAYYQLTNKPVEIAPARRTAVKHPSISLACYKRW